MSPWIGLVSFDVWETLLRIDPMIEALSRGIAGLLDLDAEFVRRSILNTYRDIKPLLISRELDDREILEASQSMLAERLNSTIEEIRAGISRGVASLNPGDLLFPDVLDSLKTLSERVSALCIVGNTTFWPGRHTRRILDELGLSRFFRVQLYSDEVGVAKPDRSIFLRACEICGVPAPEAVHVGDNPFEDVGGALSAGMKAALIRRDLGGVELIEELGVAVIPSLRSLPDILDKLSAVKIKIPWIK